MANRCPAFRLLAVSTDPDHMRVLAFRRQEARALAWCARRLDWVANGPLSEVLEAVQAATGVSDAAALNARVTIKRNLGYYR